MTLTRWFLDSFDFYSGTKSHLAMWQPGTAPPGSWCCWPGTPTATSGNQAGPAQGAWAWGRESGVTHRSCTSKPDHLMSRMVVSSLGAGRGAGWGALGGVGRGPEHEVAVCCSSLASIGMGVGVEAQVESPHGVPVLACPAWVIQRWESGQTLFGVSSTWK